MSDIVERLEYCAKHGIMDASRAGMAAGYGEAAAEIKKLREALKPFAEVAKDYEDWETDKITVIVLLRHVGGAAAALKDTNNG